MPNMALLLLSMLSFVQKRTMGQLALETVEVRTFAFESNLIFVSFLAAGCSRMGSSRTSIFILFNLNPQLLSHLSLGLEKIEFDTKKLSV